MTRKSVRLLPHSIDGTQALQCPSCKGHYLHQVRAEVFDRSEDAAIGHHVTVTSTGVQVDHSQANNPSARRDGIRISFDCELCEAKPVLTVVQHKGTTLVEWEAF